MRFFGHHTLLASIAAFFLLGVASLMKLGMRAVTSSNKAIGVASKEGHS